MTRHERIVLLLVGLLIWVGLASAQVVDVPDTNLREAIREQLALPADGPLTQQEMMRLTRLEASQRQIAKLTGLEHATNLERLYAWGNPISDLSPLANLTQLRELDLGGCEISDITPLAKLEQLERLNLRDNYIVDVSPLAGLTQLKGLWINDNRIIDHSPLAGLSLIDFEWDESCELPSTPVETRIRNRSYPSIFAAWGGVGWSPVQNLSELSDMEQIALHDFYWSGAIAGQHFLETADGWRIVGDLSRAQERRDAYLDLNPNMVFIAEVRIRDASLSDYPENFRYWLRDTKGNRIKHPVIPNNFLTDFTQLGMQEIIIHQAVAVAKCGLYDGIFFDWFAEDSTILFSQGVEDTEGDHHYYSNDVEQQAKDNILQGIRDAVRDDFLIIINTNRHIIPRRAWGINGTFMETIQDTVPAYRLPVIDGHPYGYEGLKNIESTLTWAEENLREPRVNCLEGWGTPNEPPDSPTNKRFMRVFTTMSLTHSDGYVLYGMDNSHRHIWHDFWNADLGYPVGAKAQAYEDIDGLFIREFTNGWAVYNRSGHPQTITLPQFVNGVGNNKGRLLTHMLPDLDGEIYLKVGMPIDLNADGTINVLDLIMVSRAFGTTKGDINGDGETNVLDLMFVAQQFGENE